MARFTRIAAAVLCGAAGALGAALAIGGRSWKRGTTDVIERLGSSSTKDLPPRYDPAQLAGLPEPVVRYFTFALTPGQPLVRRVRFEQEGTFATAKDRWSSFTATEHFAVSPPGFVWDARIRMAPLVTVHVRDSYAAGVGVMHGAIAGLVTVVDQRDTPEMASGALLRYLAEAAWFPTALLPACGVRWEALDVSTARATLGDSGTTVSMDVHFGASGEIDRISAMRHRDVKGTPVLTPWIGRFADYARVEGMMVPTRSEVGWALTDGWFPYWRGRNVKTEIEYVAE